MILVGLLIQSVVALSFKASQQPRRPPPSRRDILLTAGGISGFLLSQPAQAIKERNEALCGTGFFTNIWQFKCTDIGDIEDEGIPTGLSTGQEEISDSLLSKLGVDDSTTDGSLVKDAPTGSKPSIVETKEQ